MKGLIVTADHRLELRELGAPEPGPYEALVRIRACGICSTTDRELVAGTQPYNSSYPCLLGHEAVGEVVRTGAKVRSFAPGDWVTRPVGIWPGESRDGLASAWGGFAEYGIVRDRVAMAADGDGSLSNDYTALRQNRIAAAGLGVHELVLAISLAETASWTWGLPPLGGRSVCVAGTGIAGLSIALWAKLTGARRVTVLGRRAGRLDLARAVAADCAIDTGAAGWTTQVGTVDVFCDAVGSRSLLQAGLGLLTPDGTAAIYGVIPGGHGIEAAALSGRRLITPSAEEHLAYAWVLDAIRRGLVPVDCLMTNRWPLARAVEAFAAVGDGDVVKGMIELS